jgi:hypothetical protein
VHINFSAPGSQRPRSRGKNEARVIWANDFIEQGQRVVGRPGADPSWSARLDLFGLDGGPLR